MEYAHTLIVGGGPADSSAARFLASAGFETILAGRDFSYVKPCGGAVSSSALEEFGISSDVVQKKINSILIVSPKRKRFHITLKGEFLCMLERGSFNAYLRSIAEMSIWRSGSCCTNGLMFRNLP